MIEELPAVLRPDPSRVVIRPFTPSDNPIAAAGERSRSALIVSRVLGLDSATLKSEVERVVGSLRDRHRQVEQVLMRRYHDVGPAGDGADPDQALLIGAYFSEEYSFEATALFNPSMVLHPDQTGMADGMARFVMSLRSVGEGHVSSITFRTGEFSTDGKLTLREASTTAISPRIEFIPGAAADDPGVRLLCGASEDLSAIVLFPVTLRQRHGLEDLRLVRFTDEDDTVSFLGTYSAFSGDSVRQELLRTTDFSRFEMTALSGDAAATKGLALFPRRVDGHFAMLGRMDHDSIWLMRSPNLHHWTGGVKIVEPRWPWEFIQIGNCGSPIEIEEGWLVLIHGVGPVRNYCIGACLLDKANPAKVLGRTILPLVSTSAKDRDGYVPNVVYSCGALVLGRKLLLPYGVADTYTAFASCDLDDLMRAMA